MIQYNGKYYTVDAGTGAIYGFMKRPAGHGPWDEKTEFALRDINAMFFTHLHQDHSTGYADIMTPRWMTSTEPGAGDMLLAGPWHTGLLHDHLLTFYRDDLVYRLLRKVAEWGHVGGGCRKRHVQGSHHQGDGRPGDTSSSTA